MITASMKQILTLLAAGAFATSAHAQPTLTFVSNAPEIGTQYTQNYGNYVAPGNPGAMQTWDLTGLMIDSTDVIQMVAPSSTPNGDQFPNATIAATSNPVITYYQVTPNGIFFTGSDDGTSVIVNIPAPKYLAFPATMGSNWSSDFEAEFTYEGNTVTRSGTVNCEVDGYGTLQMPFGSVQNVLRIHMMNEIEDVMDMFTIDYTYDSYLYYTPGQFHPIAELVTGTIDMGFGSPTVIQFSRWAGDVTTDLSAATSLNDHLRVYPVPANDVLNIKDAGRIGEIVNASVLDAAGRVVLQTDLVVEEIIPLDLQELKPGAYTLYLVDPKGQRGTTRFTKL